MSGEEIDNLTKQSIIDYLSQDKRFDSRKLLEMRNLTIETGISMNAEGSARVKLGDTEIIVGVKMDVTEPYTDHEEEGTLITTLELSPIASKEFESGPPKIEAIEMGRLVDRGVRESGFIDFKKLCIKKGEKVWGIFLDLFAINDAGNLLDAGVLGALAALLTARFPKYDEKKIKVVYGEFTKDKLPLTKTIPITFTFYKIGDKIIFDPIKSEEKSADARLTIGISEYNKKLVINSMQKGLETPFTKKELTQIFENAEKAYKDVLKKLEDSVK